MELRVQRPEAGVRQAIVLSYDQSQVGPDCLISAQLFKPKLVKVSPTWHNLPKLHPQFALKRVCLGQQLEFSFFWATLWCFAERRGRENRFSSNAPSVTCPSREPSESLIPSLITTKSKLTTTTITKFSCNSIVHHILTSDLFLLLDLPRSLRIYHSLDFDHL